MPHGHRPGPRPAIRSADVASAYSRGGDVGAQRPQLAREVLVAAPDVVGVRDEGLAVGTEGRYQEGGAGPDVGRPNGRAGEPGPPRRRGGTSPPRCDPG